VTLAAKFGVDGKIVQPAAMALVAGHDAGDQTVPDLADQKARGIDVQFALDVGHWIISRNYQSAGVPASDDVCVVAGSVDANPQFGVGG
jgi:hypothetical protein